MTETTAPAGPSPVTSAEKIRWQRRAAILLERLLELAAQRDLPAISWTISSAGASLAGECLHPHSDRRAQLEAWRQALGKPDTFHEADLGDGGAQVTAVWDKGGEGGRNPLLDDKSGWKLASVVISARILPGLDGE